VIGEITAPKYLLFDSYPNFIGLSIPAPENRLTGYATAILLFSSQKLFDLPPFTLPDLPPKEKYGRIGRDGGGRQLGEEVI
jgi:hypothetical protein